LCKLRNVYITYADEGSMKIGVLFYVWMVLHMMDGSWSFSECYLVECSSVWANSTTSLDLEESIITKTGWEWTTTCLLSNCFYLPKNIEVANCMSIFK